MNEIYTSKAIKSTRQGFGEAVLQAGINNSKVVVLGADITASVGLDMFAKQFPNRFFSLGIAEQNCIGIAAGMALNGLIPVFSTYAAFASTRAADQIRVSLCYNNLPAIIGGAHAGISVGPDGATHQALEDIAFMRVLPNMTVISPCDYTQAKLLTLMAIQTSKGPVYIRYGRNDVPDFTHEDQKLQMGKGQILTEGHDITLIATGHLVWEVLQCIPLLKKYNISARLINLHTIKPIDKELIIESAIKTKKIVTFEEHQLNAGMGSAVCEVVSEFAPVPVKRIGIPDCFGESGQPEALFEKFQLSSDKLLMQILNFLKCS